MTRRRWIADEVSGNRAALIGPHADHLIRVLRVRVAQEFDIIANGVVYRGRVHKISDGRVEFELLGEVPSATPVPVTVLLSIFKFDRMEWAVEKCTELGVARIVPVIARRTDVHLASAAIKRVDRWRRIAMQAAEQSRRVTPPEISAPTKLREAASLTAGLKVVLSESEQDVDLREALTGRHTADGEVLLAVGPEGGWTGDELEAFHAEGWVFATLGPTILRAETAAIAAAAITIVELSSKTSLSDSENR